MALALSGLACNFLTSVDEGEEVCALKREKQEEKFEVLEDSGVSEFFFLDPELAIIVTESGLQYQDEVTGEGRAAQAGDFVVMHYIGWLTDCTKFDSSYEGGYPVEVLLGMESVIVGWHEGILGMQPGGVRLLIIPPELAYGAPGLKPIPPNEILLFWVNLLAVAE